MASSLARYFVLRTIQTLITYIVIVAIVFWLLELLPYNPVTLLMMTPGIKQSQIHAMIVLYGFNQPLWIRFFIYMRNMLTFNFGISYYYTKPVIDLIGTRLPRTLLLVGGATLISYIVGYFVGTLIAWRRGGIMDSSNVVIGLVFYNMPVFWLGLIFIYVFAFKLGWFPIAGFFDPTNKIFGLSPHSLSFYVLDVLWHTALPMIVLVLVSLAGSILLMRTAMLDVLGEPYIQTAVAKGLPEKDVIYKHAARNALLPLVTSFIIAMAFIMGGVIITETVFSYQGIGYLYWQSLLHVDYPVIEATTILIALLVIIFNWIADLIYGVLDPRVRIY